MKKILLLLIPVFALSAGPRYSHKDRFIDQEFENVYHDIRNASGDSVDPLVTSSATITNLTVTGAYTAGITLGKVKRILNFTSTTATSTSASTFQNSSLTLAITPGSVNYKILVIASGTGQVSGAGNGMKIAVYRDSTNITSPHGARSSLVGQFSWSIAVVDSPATTSSRTYTIQFLSENGTNNVFLTDGALGSIILVEFES